MARQVQVLFSALKETFDVNRRKVQFKPLGTLTFFMTQAASCQVYVVLQIPFYVPLVRKQ